ncbi:TerD family protein [Streptomyces sp. NPDC056486]|uniref:TerD family protein n=1 Tax=Streptomyces sp. NPDC056486 TaxID=3345835 RepID=UPI003696E8B4
MATSSPWSCPRFPTTSTPWQSSPASTSNPSPWLSSTSTPHGARTSPNPPVKDCPLSQFPSFRATVAIAVEVYRLGSGWKVRAVGQGYDTGLAGLAADYGINVDS